jgi:hypothetical protein
VSLGSHPSYTDRTGHAVGAVVAVAVRVLGVRKVLLVVVVSSAS